MHRFSICLVILSSWGAAACSADTPSSTRDGDDSGSAHGGRVGTPGTGGRSTPTTGGTAGTPDAGEADASAGIAGAPAAGGHNATGGAGGRNGTGGATGGSPHVVGKCDALAAAGTWEEITPAEVSLDSSFKTPAGDNFGDHSFVIDPQNTAHIYLGTSAQGIFESKDCGATWKKVDTGRNADKLDGGRQWTFVIDPVDPKVLYANAGYGSNNAWKSINGGVDWDEFIDPAYAAALQFGGFVHSITMDPTDHQHLIVTPHFECEIGKGPGGLPLTKGCLVETTDAGKTWKIREGTPGSGESAGQWMVDSKLWFWAEGFPGLWRTENGGESWEHVYTAGYATAGGFHLAGDPYYTGGVFSVLTSADGKSWSSLDGAPGIDFLVGDSTTLFGARGAAYWSTSAIAPKTWTRLPSPPFANPDSVRGWGIKYDPDHKLLYSLNSTDGFWRMVVP
jgi:hypothetical protein